MSETNKATLESVSKALYPNERQSSFDELFSRHYKAIFRTARAIVGDSLAAEEVTQEVFLRLYRNLDATPGDDLLRAWLLRVTLNVARNTVRGQSFNLVRDSDYNELREEKGTPFVATEDTYEHRMAIEEARRALDKIKEPMRSCLLLKQQGFSYKEIAASLSIKDENIGSLVARGRREFARVYGKIGGPGTKARVQKVKPTKNPVSLLKDSEITQVVPEAASTQIPDNEIKAAVRAIKIAIDESVESMHLAQQEIIQLQVETRNVIDRLETSH
jgi:RNA polymerase sigma factor (sigma-70 family)